MRSHPWQTQQEGLSDLTSPVCATQERGHSAVLCQPATPSARWQGWPGLHPPLAQPHLIFPHSNTFFLLHRLFMKSARQKLDFFQECEARAIVTQVTICAGRARAPCSPHFQVNILRKKKELWGLSHTSINTMLTSATLWLFNLKHVFLWELPLSHFFALYLL